MIAEAATVVVWWYYRISGGGGSVVVELYLCTSMLMNSHLQIQSKLISYVLFWVIF